MSPTGLPKAAAAIAIPFRDAGWARKCLAQGVRVFVPILGVVTLLAWQRRVFVAVRSGTALPEGTWSTRGAGAPLLATVLLALAFALPIGGAAIAIGASGHRVSGFLPPEIVQPVVLVLWLLAYPELLRRAYAEGNGLGIFTPWRSVALVLRHPVDYLVTVGGTFVAFIVFVLGCNACLVGGILSIPAGAMLLASLVARWQSCIDAPPSDARPYR